MTEVILHVYDVTSGESEKMNNAICQVNKIFKDRIGIGGIFHSAIQVYGNEEWSFGYCSQGTGVFSCDSGQNELYKYREQIVLGRTELTIVRVGQILYELSREWLGSSYDLLARNCNHFCEELCKRLGIHKLPGWLNRFAHAGDAVAVVLESTASWFRQAKTGIMSAGKTAFRFVAGATSDACRGSPPSSSNRRSPNSQAFRFKNLSMSKSKSFTDREDRNRRPIP